MRGGGGGGGGVEGERRGGGGGEDFSVIMHVIEVSYFKGLSLDKLFQWIQKTTDLAHTYFCRDLQQVVLACTEMLQVHQQTG